MAKRRKAVKRKSPSGGLASLLEQCRKAYADAEPMGVAPFVPAVGTYKAHLSGFTTEEREARDGSDYMHIRLQVTIDEEPYNERETAVTFHSLVTGQSKKTKDNWGLKRFKGLSAVLNEGEPIEDWESSLDFVKSCAEEMTPVILVVDEYEAADGSVRRNASISELDLTAVAPTADDSAEEEEAEEEANDEDEDEDEDDE